MPVQFISMAELSQRNPGQAADELVLDVRSPEEFRDGHVAGSRNIPSDQFAQYLEEIRGYRIVFIYCRSGKRAESAAQILRSMGLTNLVCVVQSGMPDWISAGLPVEKG